MSEVPAEPATTQPKLPRPGSLTAFVLARLDAPTREILAQAKERGRIFDKHSVENARYQLRSKGFTESVPGLADQLPLAEFVRQRLDMPSAELARILTENGYGNTDVKRASNLKYAAGRKRKRPGGKRGGGTEARPGPKPGSRPPSPPLRLVAEHYELTNAQMIALAAKRGISLTTKYVDNLRFRARQRGLVKTTKIITRPEAVQPAPEAPAETPARRGRPPRAPERAARTLSTATLEKISVLRRLILEIGFDLSQEVFDEYSQARSAMRDG